jgi:hypothetical protein
MSTRRCGWRYRENLSDRVIEADDLVFCDVGPLAEAWEADFGRT